MIIASYDIYYRRAMINKKQTIAENDKLRAKGLLVGSMDKYTTRQTKEAIVRNHFVKWIVLNRLPFNLGESEHFRDFCLA
jgi:hypothetical protein